MSFKHSVTGIIAGLVVFAFAFPSAAADMRAAKKEGKILWYTSVSLPVAQRVCKAFNAKKMGLECEVHRDGSGKLYRRYLQEAKGGIYAADIIHTSNLGHFFNLQKKHLSAYSPPGIEKFNPKFRTSHGNWHVLRAGVLMPFYNTQRVKPGDVPKSYADFLKPRWKGKLVHSHPSYSGFVTNGMINIVKIFGWDYYKKVAAQKPKIVQSALGGIPLVARGEADAGMGTVSYGLLKAIQKGEPLKPIIPKEGVALVTSPNAILKKAPHPNAAKIFTDYLFSLEAQQLLANEFLYVGHPDVKYPEGLPALKELKLLTISGPELKKKNKPTRKEFRKIFGV